ncbi:MAG: molybdenum cofactor biosynthesis protein MoaE [Nocardioides sp.]|uniref:molybdenum cofactor biosynthesis protein MoaE n=1 Tax=Nocardioides sp. TaxID=35761 RepID=UPI003F12B526
MTSPQLPAVRLCEIRDTPLDVLEVVAAVDDATAGGVNVFVGRVRDHDSGRGVEGLEYSAHPSAAARLREVCDRVVAAHGVTALAAVHRTGTLQIGDLAVVVATAGAHRGETFEATRDLIDWLKAEVPIWKHQRFDDGDEEWVGTP